MTHRCHININKAQLKFEIGGFGVLGLGCGVSGFALVQHFKKNDANFEKNREKK